VRKAKQSDVVERFRASKARVTTKRGARAGGSKPASRSGGEPKGRPRATRAETEARRSKRAKPARSTAPPAPPRSRTRTVPPRPALAPADMLQRAMAATTPRARALWARRGLSTKRRLDRTIQSMLLRQLYLAYFESQRFDKALEIARQNLRLEVLPDVVHQDAARAASAMGDVDEAAGHLRLAARVGPAKRRAFHWWTLGSVYFLAGRNDDAVSALTRAARWGTTDKPLYQGHLALARCAAGEDVPDLLRLMERLAEVPAGQGYGRFVLGQLAYRAQRWDEARQYLEAFVRRSEGGRVAVALALAGEIALARKTLAGLETKG
jgi:tetratricopeptide (TPR) repeat protein